jgi:hypothetical protein
MDVRANENSTARTGYSHAAQKLCPEKQKYKFVRRRRRRTPPRPQGKQENRACGKAGKKGLRGKQRVGGETRIVISTTAARLRKNDLQVNSYHSTHMDVRANENRTARTGYSHAAQKLWGKGGALAPGSNNTSWYAGDDVESRRTCFHLLRFVVNPARLNPARLNKGLVAGTQAFISIFTPEGKCLGKAS